MIGNTLFPRAARGFWSALTLVLVWLTLSGAASPDRRFGAATRGTLKPLEIDPPGVLIRNDVTLAPSAISPGVSPTVQDTAFLRFTIISADTLKWGVFIDVATGGDPEPPVPGAYILDGKPLQGGVYVPNTRFTVPITGTFTASGTTVTLEDGNYTVVLSVVSPRVDRNEQVKLPLTIDRQMPRFLSVPVVKDRKTTPYRNGDTIVIEAKLDGSGYAVTANFDSLDNDTSAGATQIIDAGDGSYSIRHTLSEGNTRPDGRDLSVPLTFKDRAGNSLRDASLFFCMVNNPPRITSVKFVGVGETPHFKNGDTLNIETRWEPRGVPLTLTAQAWGISDPFNPLAVTITPPAPEDNLYLIRYVIPGNNTKQDGDYCLRIQAATPGCAVAVDQTKICATLDNARISGLTLDPFAPTTRDTALVVTGAAPGAETVRFKRGDTVVTTAAADAATGRFSTPVALITGLNTILVESFDAFGSRGPVQTIEVTRVTRGFLELASRVKPGAVIRVATSQTATSIRVEMWDLAGNLVALLEDGRRRDFYEFTWDGQTTSGQVLRTGPLICRVDASLVDGSHELTNRAFVFTAR